MRILVGCEFSGIVRDAFIARGHDAMSCDILPSERPGPHYQGDIRDVLGEGWDLAIFHPPCTHLAVSGARWWREKFYDQEQAIAFVRMLMVCGIPRIAIENPISLISSRIRKPDQIIQPWMFGHGETKKTCLWLKNLPPLWPTNIAPGNEARVWKMPPGENRWRERSRTYPGIAEAMAEQWGGLDSMSAPRPRRTKVAATPTLPPTPLEQFIAADNAARHKDPETEYQRMAVGGARAQLEAAYLLHLRLTTDMPEPQQQYAKLVPGRRYRADFAWPDVRLVVECDGGAWLGARGGHTSAAGMERDRERDILCALAGWTVLRVTASMIATGKAAYYTEQLYKMLRAKSA